MNPVASESASSSATPASLLPFAQLSSMNSGLPPYSTGFYHNNPDMLHSSVFGGGGHSAIVQPPSLPPQFSSPSVNSYSNVENFAPYAADLHYHHNQQQQALMYEGVKGAAPLNTVISSATTCTSAATVIDEKSLVYTVSGSSTSVGDSVINNNSNVISTDAVTITNNYGSKLAKKSGGKHSPHSTANTSTTANTPAISVKSERIHSQPQQQQQQQQQQTHLQQQHSHQQQQQQQLTPKNNSSPDGANIHSTQNPSLVGFASTSSSSPSAAINSTPSTAAAFVVENQQQKFGSAVANSSNALSAISTTNNLYAHHAGGHHSNAVSASGVSPNGHISVPRSTALCSVDGGGAAYSAATANALVGALPDMSAIHNGADMLRSAARQNSFYPSEIGYGGDFGGPHHHHHQLLNPDGAGASNNLPQAIPPYDCWAPSSALPSEHYAPANIHGYGIADDMYGLNAGNGLLSQQTALLPQPHPQLQYDTDPTSRLINGTNNGVNYGAGWHQYYLGPGDKLTDVDGCGALNQFSSQMNTYAGIADQNYYASTSQHSLQGAPTVVDAFVAAGGTVGQHLNVGGANSLHCNSASDGVSSLQSINLQNAELYGSFQQQQQQQQLQIQQQNHFDSTSATHHDLTPAGQFIDLLSTQQQNSSQQQQQQQQHLQQQQQQLQDRTTATTTSQAQLSKMGVGYVPELLSQQLDYGVLGDNSGLACLPPSFGGGLVSMQNNNICNLPPVSNSGMGSLALPMPVTAATTTKAAAKAAKTTRRGRNSTIKQTASSSSSTNAVTPAAAACSAAASAGIIPSLTMPSDGMRAETVVVAPGGGRTPSIPPNGTPQYDSYYNTNGGSRYTDSMSRSISPTAVAHKIPRKSRSRTKDSEDDDGRSNEDRDVERRTANNTRERIRVRDINSAFKELAKLCSQHMPNTEERGLTKLGTLLKAVDLIPMLEQKVRERNLDPRMTSLKRNHNSAIGNAGVGGGAISSGVPSLPQQ